ncbi:MAG TPA: alpha/beta hydrolase [Tepidiformaceae bacterium]|nr:alpha/beta hydrolase [Tepidiformaceae bacterium]
MVMSPYLEKDATVGGLKLHYQEWGDANAPTILMLHGFGVSGHMFDEFANLMQDRYRLIALDQRGHGDSDWSDEGDYSRDAFVADVEGFRTALGLDRFILMGHSMGGLNAVAYAVEHAEHVRALVLVDVGPEAAKEGVDNIHRFTQGPDELEFDQFVEMAHRFNQRRSIENIRERMRFRLKPMENGKWTWKFDKRFRQAENGLRIGSELSNDESWQLFRSVTVPTLLVRGADSDVLMQDVADRAVGEMPRARLVIVSKAGHSVPGDNPAEFTEAVRGFLSDVEGGRFQPAPAASAPALEEALERNGGGNRRGSLVPFVAAGVGLVLALAGASYLFRGKKRSQPRGVSGKARAVAGRLHAPARLSAADLEMAQRRAADLAHELAGRSRAGIAHARAATREVDVESARRAALDVLHSLEERSREAPVVAKSALTKAEKMRANATKDARKKKGRPSSMLLRTAMMIAPMLLSGAAKSRKKQKKRGLKRAWRS